jgi:hypothetical protein
MPKLNVPVLEGVPAIVPLLDLSVNPGGNPPQEMLKLKGAVPLLTLSVEL